jgi:hypothetical protein
MQDYIFFCAGKATKSVHVYQVICPGLQSITCYASFPEGPVQASHVICYSVHVLLYSASALKAAFGSQGMSG